MTTQGFLSGIRVIDCSLLGPAALAGHLVDFGAEVIKIESPAGDYGRQMTWPIVEGESLLHHHINRGKKSVVLDLKNDEGKKIFAELIKTADVVIEAMRPGFLNKIGFGFEKLKELNSRIVFCSISGYGATGPYKNLPSHGIAYDTWSGVLAPVTDELGFERIPNQANVGIVAGPAFGAMAILAALVRARTTGEAAAMEVAQSDAAAYFDWYRIETYKAYERPQSEVTGNPSDNFERREPGLAGMWPGGRYQFYKSKNGHILFMASEQAFWKNFCNGIGRMDLFEKWPGATYGDHARGNLELQAELKTIFLTKTTEEWIAFGNEHNTTLAAVNTPKTVVDDPQFKDRFTWTTKEQTGSEMMLFPLHIDGEELPVPSRAPTCGQHTEEVLRDVLGMDASAIAKVRESGAIG
jgi:crotonobetainyl-CoA:carnitine CoA-transferase CaiB-like acyl-CoA transferase